MPDTPVDELPELTETAAQPAALPWAEVSCEHFQLLRLAPLPVDRSTGARPLRFVQLGRAERHSPALSLLRLQLQLPNEQARKEQNQLDVWLDHEQRAVRVQPPGGLHVEPGNRGIGRLVLAKAAEWAQRHGPQYRLEGAELAARESLAPDLRERRDHALRTLGLDVEYADAQFQGGRYKSTSVGQLHSQWNADKIQAVSLLDAAQLLQNADQSLQEQAVKVRKLEERISLFQREDSGLRFTIACLIAFAVFQAGLLIWIATHR